MLEPNGSVLKRKSVKSLSVWKKLTGNLVTTRVTNSLANFGARQTK